MTLDEHIALTCACPHEAERAADGPAQRDCSALVGCACLVTSRRQIGARRTGSFLLSWSLVNVQDDSRPALLDVKLTSGSLESSGMRNEDDAPLKLSQINRVGWIPTG